MKFPVLIALISAMAFLASCAQTRQPAAGTQSAGSSPAASPSAAVSSSIKTQATGSSALASPTDAATVDAAQARSITPADAKARLKAGEDITLLDVRTAHEYESGHITGSILLPLDELETRAPKLLKDKDAVIFVYCRSGRRSKIAAEMLAGMGYTQVYDLGGIIDWPYGTSTN